MTEQGSLLLALIIAGMVGGVVIDHRLDPDRLDDPGNPHRGDRGDCTGTLCPVCGCCMHCLPSGCGCTGDCDDATCGCAL